MISKRTSILFLAAAVTVSLAAATTKTKSKNNSPPALDGSTVLEHIRYLAADARGGRGNGTPGLEESARYIAQRFERYGLVPAGDKGSYYQTFAVSLGANLGAGNALRLQGKEDVLLALHRDYEPLSFTAGGKVSSAVIFAGYGITAPEKSYDDYGSLSVKDKAVLVLRHQPREKREDGPFGKSGHATFVNKAINAKAHGATAILFVNDPLNHRGESDDLVKFTEDLGADNLGIPAVFVKRESVEKLLAPSGKSLEALQQAIDRDLAPQSFAVEGARVALTLDVERMRGDVKNVLGYLPPPNASGDEELIVIGAHYDHLGLGQRFSTAPEAKGQIHNGADDNASGTAGVIELAHAFGAKRAGLSRGILFVAFAGEELGLLGSTHYVNHPFRPMDKTVAMVNLDMIGRLRDTLYVGGVSTSPVFRAKLEELGGVERVSYSFGFSGNGSSDHTSFIMKEVPALFFFTGLHGDYHKPSDDMEKIDAAGEERVLRIAYAVADFLQATPERPQFARESGGERPREAGGPGYGAYFGSVPDFGFEGPGVRFADVTPGSPAASAGLQKGDVLVLFDGANVDTLYDFTDALRRRKPGDVVAVTVVRGTERVDASVTLGKRP